MKFPGKNSRAVLDKANLYYATNTASSRIIAEMGYNAIITDLDGFEFIDLDCGAGVNNLGMNNPHLWKAIQAQLGTGIIHTEHHNAPNPVAVELSEILATTCPVKKPSKVFLSNSGAEANVAAIKACMSHRFHNAQRELRQNVIYFENGFAGRMLGLLAATCSNAAAQRDPYWTHCDREHTIYLPYPTKANADLLKNRLANINLQTVDHLLIELPCQGEGGIIYADEEVLKYLYKTTQAAGIFWITDSIQCGMGRCGVLYGPEIFPWLQSDILTLAKALGGGLPIGATVFQSNLDWQPGEHSNTFGGARYPCRLALIVIEEVKKLIATGAVERIAQVIESFRPLFLAHPCVTDLRGTYAMWAIELTTPDMRDRVVRIGEELTTAECYGIKLLAAGKKSIRIMPPLTIEEKTLTIALQQLSLALCEADIQKPLI